MRCALANTGMIAESSPLVATRYDQSVVATGNGTVANPSASVVAEASRSCTSTPETAAPLRRSVAQAISSSLSENVSTPNCVRCTHVSVGRFIQ